MPSLKKIMIVEDDAVITRIYERQFIMAGYTVELAPDGDAAIEKLKSLTPDLILLDLQLPKVNGVEVLKFIRSQPATKEVPVVVFTNSYLGNMVQQAWQAGANKCLTKAICTPKQVMEVVRVTLSENDKIKMPELPPPGVKLAGAPLALSPSVPLPPVEEVAARLQPEINASFLAEGQQIIGMLRGRVQTLTKIEADPNAPNYQNQRLMTLQEIYQVLHSLTGKAGLAGATRIATFSSAVEAFTKELHDRPRSLNTSSLRTFANSVDQLAQIVDAGPKEEPLDLDQAVILVVDDEPISRKTVIAGLEKAGLNAIGVDDPHKALELVREKHFDVIFLDVQMPGMTGHELCLKIRSTSTNNNTPVIFVTAMTDFASRAKSTLSGGNDLLGKPFLAMELAVKALSYLLKSKAKDPHKVA